MAIEKTNLKLALCFNPTKIKEPEIAFELLKNI